MTSFCKHQFAEPPPGMSPSVFRHHLKRAQLDAMKTAAQQGQIVLSVFSAVAVANVAWGGVSKSVSLACLAQCLLLQIVASLSGGIPNLLSRLGPRGITFFHVAIYGWMILLYVLTPASPWGAVSGSMWHFSGTEEWWTAGSGFAHMFFCTAVRLVSAVFFETSGFFTVVSFELTWLLALWGTRSYYLFRGDTCLMVAAITIWRLRGRSAAVKELLTAKNSALMRLSIGTLLKRVCDATVELNHEGVVSSPAPQLAALLLRSGRLAEQRISTGSFVDLVEESERKQFTDHLISANKELLLKQGDKSLPTAQMKLNLLDAGHASVAVDLYHVCFAGIDDQPRHLLGIVEHTEDQRELPGHRDKFVARKREEIVDSGSECSSDGSSKGDITSLMPSEPLKLSWWIVPDSSEFTVRKATVLADMLWGPTLSITSLRSQIWKKHRCHMKIAVRIICQETIPGVDVEGIIFEPLAFQQQKIGFSAHLRLWAPTCDELIQIDVIEHEWFRRRPQHVECDVYRLEGSATEEHEHTLKCKL